MVGSLDFMVGYLGSKLKQRRAGNQLFIVSAGLEVGAAIRGVASQVQRIGETDAAWVLKAWHGFKVADEYAGFLLAVAF
jgi:hypothetical protein